MGWLSFFRPRSERAASTDAGAAPGTDSVARARTRARQRLVGAIVLVVIGVIGFPLVFETRPRPIPVDVAIEIPRKDTAPPLKVPTPVAPRPAEMSTEAPADAGRELAARPAASSRPAASAAPAREVAESAPVEAVAAAAPKPASAPAPARPPAKPAAEGARAKTLLDGADASAKAAGRFVVQVGAFADSSAASELRGKAEKLGLKTYTQVTDTPAGKRIRVRLGPFASRDEADSALAKARAGGLAGNVLSL